MQLPVPSRSYLSNRAAAVPRAASEKAGCPWMHTARSELGITVTYNTISWGEAIRRHDGGIIPPQFERRGSKTCQERPCHHLLSYPQYVTRELCRRMFRRSLRFWQRLTSLPGLSRVSSLSACGIVTGCISIPTAGVHRMSASFGRLKCYLGWQSLLQCPVCLRPSHTSSVELVQSS